MIVLPAFIDLQVEPHQSFQFTNAFHTADERGVLANVPYDVAQVYIAAGLAKIHDGEDEQAIEIVDEAPAVPKIEPTSPIKVPDTEPPVTPVDQPEAPVEAPTA